MKTRRIGPEYSTDRGELKEKGRRTNSVRYCPRRAERRCSRSAAIVQEILLNCSEVDDVEREGDEGENGPASPVVKGLKRVMNM